MFSRDSREHGKTSVASSIECRRANHAIGGFKIRQRDRHILVRLAVSCSWRHEPWSTRSTTSSRTADPPCSTRPATRGLSESSRPRRPHRRPSLRQPRGAKYTKVITTPLLNLVSRLRHAKPGYSIVLVDHSLGGSIATLITLVFANFLPIRPRRSPVITSNKPRLRPRPQRARFNFTRVVNKDDPCCGVPR